MHWALLSSQYMWRNELQRHLVGCLDYTPRDCSISGAQVWHLCVGSLCPQSVVVLWTEDLQCMLFPGLSAVMGLQRVPHYSDFGFLHLKNWKWREKIKGWKRSCLSYFLWPLQKRQNYRECVGSCLGLGVGEGLAATVAWGNKFSGTFWTGFWA